MVLKLPKRLVRVLTFLLIVITALFGLLSILSHNNIQPFSIIDANAAAEASQLLLDFHIKDCSILSTNCRKDPQLSMYPVDLRLGKSWTSKTYLHRKLISSTQVDPLLAHVVVDLFVANSTDPAPPLYVLQDAGKIPLKESGWTYKEHGIWLKYLLLSKAKASNVINNIEVLFGDDCVEPRPNWNLVPLPLVFHSEPGLQPYLTYQRGPSSVGANTKPVLKIGKDGRYKILQVADLHFSTGVGICRDPVPASSAGDCEADPRTLRFLNKVLDLEKPDLVVLTGDQIFGETSFDSQTTFFKAVLPFILRKIPYTVSFGNHDDEGSLSRQELMLLAQSLPYCLASEGPQDVDGVGNYLVPVELPHSKNLALSLWFLDSHKYSQSPKTNPGYDWLKESQLEWLKSEYRTLAPLREAYTHIHLSMAFFHIPLPEYREVEGRVVVGDYKEGVTAPKYNTGGHEVLKEIGVSVLSVGHDHCNDFCVLNDFWLCYGGAVGEGGYGGYGGTARRLRVFEIDTQRNDIRSWKRVETNPEEVKDSQVLVSGGEVVEK